MNLHQKPSAHSYKLRQNSNPRPKVVYFIPLYRTSIQATESIKYIA